MSTTTATFDIRPATPPLDAWVEGLWHFTDLQPDHTLEKLLPDGAVELIIDLTDFPKRLHDNESLGLKRLYRNGWISGMRTEYLVIGADPGSSMMGVRFRPGGVGAFLPCPAAEIADRVIELDELWGPVAGTLRESLLEASSVPQRFEIVERFLRTRHGERFAPVGAVTAALEQLRSTPGPLRVSDVAADLGVSQRHLIQLFDRSVGLKPKAAHRVFRFIRSLERLDRSTEPDLAELALDCGFYDQAHFNREFRAFAGATPTEYRQRGGDLLFYMILDAEPVGAPTPVKDLQDAVSLRS